MRKKLWGLLDLFRGSSAETLPEVIVKTSGIEASVEKRDGTLLHCKPENENDEKQPASIGFYYVISVRATGENPEYPAWEKPREYIFTQSLGSSQGFNGRTHFVSKDMHYSHFVIEEQFDDMKGPRMGAIRGCKFPPHHTLTILPMCAEDGRVRNVMGLGIEVRRSERESRAWKNAAESPVLGMMM